MAEAIGPMTYNIDIEGLYRLFDRFAYEAYKSNSAQISYQVDLADKTRFLAYCKMAKAFIAWFSDLPKLDLPKTGPIVINLEPSSITEMTNNEFVNTIIRLFAIARDETVKSNSTRAVCNMDSADKQRILDIIIKIEKFINEYVETVEEFDIPESAASEPITGAGRTGA
jgi:hypothetical protein